MTKRKFAGQAPLSSVRFRADSDDRDRGNHSLSTTVSPDSTALSDDFRTALNQANAYLKSLATTPRSTSSTPVMPSLSATSPSPDLDKARIDIINKLVNLLQRNLRVRYELSISDLVQASVPFLPTFLVCRLTRCPSTIPSLSDNSSKHCRAAAYRLIRHSLVDSASVEELHRQPLEWFIVKWCCSLLAQDWV